MLCSRSPATIPFWPRKAPKEVREQADCFEHLHAIDMAKEQVSKKYRLRAGAAVPPAMVEYLGKHGFTTCPAGGTITIGPVGTTHASCSIHGTWADWMQKEGAAGVPTR